MEIMLLKLYSYGKQEMLQSLQNHNNNKTQLTPKASLKYKESKNSKYIEKKSFSSVLNCHSFIAPLSDHSI